ncbi:ABC transporter permease subunit [Flavobacteriaceae bacterium R38]|nr:ABC transporter permease subunit [Flavobacteriaceae bacterium R38]
MNTGKYIAIISKSIFVVFTLIPVALGFGYAFLYSFGILGILNDGFTLAHWKKVLFTPTLWESLGFSFYIALISLTIAIVFALIIAIYLKQKLQKGFLSIAIYLPLVFPALVMAFFSFLLLSKSGWLSRVSIRLGFINELEQFPNWINDNYGIGIIFTSILLITPFFIILYTNLYHHEKLDNYKELSQSLGASPINTLRKVLIPILLRKSIFTIVLFFIFVMSSYEVPLLLGKQHPQMISVFTVDKLQRFNLLDIPQAYAISCLYGLLVLGTMALFLVKHSKIKLK